MTIPQRILIDGCTLNNVPVGNPPIQINSRPLVTVQYCNFTYSGSAPAVCGVVSAGSDNVLITNNTINLAAAQPNTTAISVVYGSSVTVQKNTIGNVSVGISLSNTSPFVFQNRITNSSPTLAVTGIGMDNSYTATVKENTVIGYQFGYKMYNSSPVMYMDSSYNTNTAGDSVNGVHAVYLSSPRLRPSYDGGGIIWDGGKNIVKTMNKGNGVYLNVNSQPDLDNGYNIIYGLDKYLFGVLTMVPVYNVTCNDWVDNPPNPLKFVVTGTMVNYIPHNCAPPGGGSKTTHPLVPSQEGNSEMRNSEIFDLPDFRQSEIRNPKFEISTDPPPPIIVNHGTAYDTVRVSTGTMNASQDFILYSQAVKDELLGSYQTAIVKYMQVIGNFNNTQTRLNSMRRLLNCYDRMNADTTAFTVLRAYYQTLIQNNQNNPALVKAGRELAAKMLVRKKRYSNAITEYEGIINTSNDQYERLCAELNIIETYLLIQQGGDAPEFTGELAYLKPNSIMDGYRMLQERLYNQPKLTQENVIPKEFNLTQNYPNPFNATTVINYQLPVSSFVKLKIYDLLGREVAVLVNDFKEAGYHSIILDGSKYSSGVYIYKIQAGKYADVRKMVLVK